MRAQYDASRITASGGTAINLKLSTGTTNYQGGAANDTFTGAYSDAGGGGDTFLSSDTINGAGGTNTLTINPFAINTATTLVDANFGNGTISNIQNLVFGNTGTGNFSLTSGNHFNSDFSTVPLNLTANTTTGTLNLAMNSFVTAATLNATSTSGNQTINIGTASGTAVDSVTSHSATGSIGITVGNGGIPSQPSRPPVQSRLMRAMVRIRSRQPRPPAAVFSTLQRVRASTPSRPRRSTR
jgi:hypothetical protein